MNNKKYLETILPHKNPMILIDDIADYNLEEKWLKSTVTIKENDIFYDNEKGGIDSVFGIEYMAQTIGCYAHIKSGETEPKIGFLLGTRLYNNAIEKFELNKTYTILVKEIFNSEIYSFECFIYNEKNKEISSATINVYQANVKEKSIE